RRNCARSTARSAGMDRPRPQRKTGVDRRTFLRRTGLVAGAAGLEGILGGRRAPAYAQGTKLHLLRWNDFVPACDEELRRQIGEAGRALGATVTLETINANDLQPRITSAVQSGTGPDIIMLLHNWPHLYEASLVDVTDLAEWQRKDQGAYYSQSEAAARVGSRWMALPHSIAGAQLPSRSAAWDDTNNNRAFLAGEISATLNGASIFIAAKRGADKLKDEKGQPLWQDIQHGPIPSGTAGTWAYHIAFSHGIMKYSKAPKLAKDFLRWLAAKEHFGKWFEAAGGFSVGANKYWEEHPMWAKLDDAMKIYRTAARVSRMFGYAGPPSAKATEVYSKYIIVDMYAKAVQGMSAADAVAWAARAPSWGSGTSSRSGTTRSSRPPSRTRSSTRSGRRSSS